MPQTSKDYYAHVIRQAADVIENNGLHHGWYFTDAPERSPADCPMCTAGALAFVLTGHPEPGCEPEEYPQFEEVIRYVSDRIYSDVVEEDPIERVADWNDTRTKAEVVATLRQIADAAEED
ncbi:hypothetical protein ABZ569_33290 [Streptomyces albus]|uniref:DUF6197 family protein n=1 Tax=Streptomyces albus TaxID=1888 RepID=UPI0034084500